MKTRPRPLFRDETSSGGLGHGTPVITPAPTPDPPSYPADLKLLWRSTDHKKSAVGPDPQYTGPPVVDAGGVAPGHGPAFTDIAALNTNETLVIKFTATKNSADIVGEEHIFGPIYADSSGLICSDGTNKARFDTTWGNGGAVTAIINTASMNAQEITAEAQTGAYYIESVIREVASYVTPSGINKYPMGAYKLICAGNVGDISLAATGGDPVADGGGTNWKCVVEYPDGSLEFNIVVSVADEMCTLLYPLSKNGPVSIWSAWESVNGQHYSKKGAACRAESLFRLDRRYAVRDKTLYSLNYEDVLTTDPWVKLNHLVWNPFGGLAANKINYNRIENPFTPDKLIVAGCKHARQFTTSAQGHGVALNIPVLDEVTGRLEFSTGIKISSASGLVKVYVGQNEVYSKPFGPHVMSHVIYFENATNIRVEVTRTTSGTDAIAYFIGALHLCTGVGESGRLISKNDKVLLCGDSWLDSNHPTGAGYKERLEQLMSGGTGVVINGAKQGMTSRWALKWLPKYLADYSPTVCILNFFVNDSNTQSSSFEAPDGTVHPLNVEDHDEWAANMQTLVGMCVDSGCTPIVMLPDTTSSESQSVVLMAMQNKLGIPKLIKEWMTHATTSEIANAENICNKRNNVPGRKLIRINDNVQIVRTDDGWQQGDAVMQLNDGNHVIFSGSLPPLSLAPSAPAKLLEVQVWDKVVGKDEIDGVPE